MSIFVKIMIKVGEMLDFRNLAFKGSFNQIMILMQ